MKDAPKKEYTPEPKPQGIMYLAVFVLYNQTVHLVPYEDKDQAKKEADEWSARQPKNFVIDHYVIKRNYDKYKDGRVV